MIYRTSPTAIEEYYNNNSLNQSSLKVIIKRGMQAYINEHDKIMEQDEYYYEEKEHFIVGSAVDCFLTRGEDVYNASYHYSNVKKPGDAILAIVKMVYDRVSPTGNVHELKDYQEEIYDACNFNKYYMNRARPNVKDAEANENIPEDNPKHITWKHDNRWLEVVKSGSAYFEDLKAANGKQVLSEAQGQTINQVVNTFTTHPFTSRIFQDGQDVDIIYQLPIYFNFNGTLCKALLDMVIINHTWKTISPADIKTIGDYVTAFPKQARVRRYDIQGSFYRYAINGAEGIKAISEILGKNVAGYRVNRFAFIVESTIFPKTPLIYPLTEELENVGMYGDLEEDLKGWRHGIDSYQLWDKHNFQMEDVYGGYGVFEINGKFKAQSLL